MKRTKLICALAGFALCGLSTLTYGAPPLAGTPIGNQAKATFTDESNVEREVFSNVVITRVSEVYAVNLEQPTNRIATPGSQVYFPHTVINEGNALDSFDLSTVLTGATELLNVFIYPDTNRDGLPDNQTPITVTPAIAPGESYSFVVAGIVPPTAGVGATGGVDVTATSVADSSQTETNADTFTVTSDAVMQVTKAVDKATGKPPVDSVGGVGEITYTITYTNTGNTTATDFTIKDVIPAGMTYVPGSARWHRSGSSALTDDLDTGVDPTGINYDFDHTATNQATFVIDEVQRGESGFVSFRVTLDDRQVPGTLINVANYEFTTGGDDKGPYPTNQVPFNVEQISSVTLTPPAAPHPAVPAGATVSWTNIVRNTGTGVDTFDIIIEQGHNFPAGTNFLLFQEDGETPMVDSNGNGIPDTGPLAVYDSSAATPVEYKVILKAILPLDVGGSSGPYSVTKTARSTKDSTVSDSGADELAGISAAAVNLTDTNPVGTAGVGEGSELHSTPGHSNTVIGGDTIKVDPGQATTLNLVVNNTSERPDSYNLLGSMNQSPSFTFGSTNHMLPGWSVVFRNTSSSAVSNTGTISGLNHEFFTAEVRVPANAAPGVYNFYVQTRSPVTGAIDHMRYQIEVNIVRKITLETDNVGQTFPGGSIEYVHILTNHGNVTEGTNTDENANDGSSSTIKVALVDTLAGAGFSSVVYYDANDNGTIDASDPVLTGKTLADLEAGGIPAGESIRLIVKVFAPLGVSESATNQTIVTATVYGDRESATGVVVNAPAAVVNTDTTMVVRGDLQVEKFQAIGVDTDGDAIVGNYVQNQISAPPGSVIIYQIVVTNTGSAKATGITVNDAIPANTVYLGSGSLGKASVTSTNAASTPEVTSEPSANGTGSLLFTIGELEPQETATIYFGVKIND